MTYENKAFPLASGSAYNQYGRRGLEDGIVGGGKLPNTGTSYEAVVYATGEDFAAGDSFVTQLQLPKGAVVTEAYAETSEAFSLGGTTPVIDVGQAGTEAANTLIQLNVSQAETAGNVSSNNIPSGVFGAPLAADTSIGVALGGTSPTATVDGRIKVVVKYTKL